MQWIKAHLTVVVCSSLSLVSVVMIVLAIFLTDVKADMEGDVGQISRLSSIEAVSQEMIEKAKTEQGKTADQLKALLETVKQSTTHEPLLPEVFDEKNETNRQAAVAIHFTELYKQKQKELLGKDKLNANGLPTPSYIASVERQMQEERLSQEQQAKVGLKSSGPSSTTDRDRLTVNRPRPFTDASRDQLTPEQLAKEDPLVRASLLWARSIYCYATVEDLDYRPEIIEGGSPPSAEDVWYAQVSLWIQEDVVNALAEVNKRAADALSNKADHWVGRLPVKRLVNLALGNYVKSGKGSSSTPEQRTRDSGAAEGLSASPDAAFTPQRGSAGSLDVIRFELGLVLDARQLLEVVDEICKRGFYTLLSVDYEAEPQDESLTSYIYGTDPTIRVTLQFEACFLRSGYQQYMPKSVVDKITAGSAGGAASGRAGRDNRGGDKNRPRSPTILRHSR